MAKGNGQTRSWLIIAPLPAVKLEARKERQMNKILDRKPRTKSCVWGI